VGPSSLFRCELLQQFSGSSSRTLSVFPTPKGAAANADSARGICEIGQNETDEQSQDETQARGAPMIVLASNCNVKDAAELKQMLCVHLDDAQPVTVDVGSVERVDTSTMQVLCAFVRDRSAHERKVQWLGDARLLGVESILCLPTDGVRP
jgi:ABC-type transporter Mla MlaB component